MAKLRGPLFSVDARGRLGTSFHVMKTPSGYKACKYTIPIDRKTPAQMADRLRFSQAVHAWQSLSAFEKSLFDSYVSSRNLHMSGYNYFCSQYTSLTPSPAPGPVLSGLASWWKFSEGSGSVVSDSIGSSHFSLLGSGGSWGPGLKNSAFNFAGGVYAEAASCPVLGQPFSFEFWARVAANVADTGDVVFHFGDFPTNSFYWISYFEHSPLDITAVRCLPTTALSLHSCVPDSSFHQFVFVWASDGFWHWYYDGVLCDSGAYNQPDSTAFPFSFLGLSGNFMCYPPAQRLHGEICCVRAYNIELSISDILQNKIYELS